MTGLEALCHGALGGVVARVVLEPAHHYGKQLLVKVGGRLHRPASRRRDDPMAPTALDASFVAEAETAFATHTSAVAGQVSAYADALADGDEVLRARLRRFEQPTSRDDAGFGPGWGWSQ